MPIEIDQRQLALAPPARAARQSPPHRLFHRVDHRPERLDIGLAEAPQEVPGRRRVGNPTRAHEPPHRLAALQRPLVFQARAVGIERVGQRQDVVGLVVRQMALEEVQGVVHLLRHPEAPDELLGQHEAAVVGHLPARVGLELQFGVP